MKSSKSYIIGAALLIAGLAIGWFIKPASNSDHNKHDNSELVDHDHDSNDQVWTCSMHPQIRQGEAGICPICEMDLIPLDNNNITDEPTVLRMSEEAVKLAQVETYVIGGDESASTEQQIVQVDGTIELDERTIKSQTAHLPGRIEQMQVTFEGQYIKKGQKIATIYSTELLAASQELITADQYNERIEGLRAAAIQKLKNWKITDQQIEAILSKNQAIETIDVFADHSGYVLNKKLSQGDYVNPGQALYTIGSTARLWLIFNAFESDLNSIKKGSKVKFTTPSVPNRSFTSTITYIDPLLNSTSRTATLRAEINNTGNLLKPGMLIQGTIIASENPKNRENESAVTVPSSSVLWTGDKSVVYVKVPDTKVPTFEFREVKLGSQMGDRVSILSGISMGDEVVVQGAFSVDAAAQLNNNFSMMNRNVAVKSVVSNSGNTFSKTTPDEFKEQLDQLVVSYIDLKNALVESNSSLANDKAANVLASLGMIKMELLDGEAHELWMKYNNAIKAHATMITETRDLAEQREQFSFLSDALINSLQAFGTDGETYFVQHCPMAKDNQGADWISDEKAIRNPYFGDKMMKCGSVKIELR